MVLRLKFQKNTADCFAREVRVFLQKNYRNERYSYMCTKWCATKRDTQSSEPKATKRPLWLFV